MKKERQLHGVIKRLPIVSWAYNSFFYTPGSWIFAAAKSDWLFQYKNYESLPLIYRLFARYFRFMQNRTKRVPISAEAAYRIASWLTKVFHLRHTARVYVKPYYVHLNLSDPRSLIVPKEIVEDQDIKIFTALISSDDTFVDVGANHGSYSIVASHRVGENGLVVAIEPQPVLAQLVEKSISDNNFSRFEVHRFACGEKEGSASFYVPKATSGSAGVYKKHSARSDHESFQVEVKRFDAAVDWRNFTGHVYVKLDIEGSEVSFLRGAHDFIMTMRPHILVEINPNSAAASGNSSVDLSLELGMLGYKYFRETFIDTLKPLEELDSQQQRNIIIVPK